MVKAHFFQGETSERILVVGGVHGEERGGLEICKVLMTDYLQDPTKGRPYYTVIVVPELFPDNVAHNRRDSRHLTRENGKLLGKIQSQESNETNRNFGVPGQTLNKAPKKNPIPDEYKTGIMYDSKTQHTVSDEDGDEMLPENMALTELMERFDPKRIISIHGTVTRDGAISKDNQELSPKAKENNDATIKMGGADKQQYLNERNDLDHELCLRAAFYTAQALSKGELQKKGSKETETFTPWKNEDALKTVGHNALKIDPEAMASGLSSSDFSDITDGNSYWKPQKSKGISLGGMAPIDVTDESTEIRPNASTITVEINGNNDSSDGNPLKKVEIKAFSEAIAMIFLFNSETP